MVAENLHSTDGLSMYNIPDINNRQRESYNPIRCWNIVGKSNFVVQQWAGQLQRKGGPMNIVSRGKGKRSLTYESVATDVQVTFTVSPAFTLVEPVTASIGVLRVMAETKGATSTSRLRKMSFSCR